jgi:hypothetical protein
MAIRFSHEVIKSMGFSPVSTTEPIIASFHSLHVYAVQGLTLEGTLATVSRGALNGTAYSFGLCTSLNSLAQELINDNLADDEPSWAQEHRCAPPYAMIHVGPTSLHTCADGHFKQEGPSLITLDAFSEAKAELRLLEDRVLPSLVTSLHCAFGAETHPVRFSRISREVFGLTPSAAVVHDIRFQINASGFVSRPLAADELKAEVASTATLANELNRKVCRFFHLGAEELDPLKRFLYFFLTLEIETHATFASIDHSAGFARLLNSEARLQATSTTLFEAQQERWWTTLLDRFVWCALCAWPSVSDADVQEFKRLKKTRDDIAHGNISEPPAEDVRAAEVLALKLLRFHV